MSVRLPKFCVVSSELMREPEALWNAHSFDWKDIESIYIWVRDMLQNGYKVVCLDTGSDQYALSAVDDELIYHKLLDLPGVTAIADPMTIPAEHFEKMEYRPDEYKNFLETIWKMSSRVAHRHLQANRLWDALYQMLWGAPAKGPEPVENKYLYSIAQRFLKALSFIPKAFIRESVNLGKVNGIYSGDHKQDALAYVWFILMESRKTWPPMPIDEYNALSAVVDLVAYSGETLKYRGALRLPDGIVEEQVDQTISGLAKWCLALIRKTVKDTYYSICKDEGTRYVKESDRFKNGASAGMFLSSSFRRNLRERPLMFQKYDPFVIEKFFKIL